MKEYFHRLTHDCKKWELVYWWILRAFMIRVKLYCLLDGSKN